MIFSLATDLLAGFGVVVAALGAMLAAPPMRPPRLPSIAEGAARLDPTGMPDLSRFQARDGTWLAYRLYPAAADRVAILVHGSSAVSDELNGLGKAFAAAGVTAVAVDMRGHGASGTRGDIAYAGQLQHDLEDLLAHLREARPSARFALVGHSLGGGFAARIAATALGPQFSRFVLVAPFLGPDAPTSGAGNKRWAAPALPRIVALAWLRRLGIPLGEHLPAIAFATDPLADRFLAPVYSFRLLADFGPDFDWKRMRAALARSADRIAVLAAENDDLMDASAFVREIAPLGVRLTMLKGVDHMGCCSEPQALGTIVEETRL
jgi:pimeloyl-ACP methyl ester carboxylesterase